MNDVFVISAWLSPAVAVVFFLGCVTGEWIAKKQYKRKYTCHGCGKGMRLTGFTFCHDCMHKGERKYGRNDI